MIAAPKPEALEFHAPRRPYSQIGLNWDYGNDGKANKASLDQSAQLKAVLVVAQISYHLHAQLNELYSSVAWKGESIQELALPSSTAGLYVPAVASSRGGTFSPVTFCCQFRAKGTLSQDRNGLWSRDTSQKA